MKDQGYCLVVVANGIASACKHVSVGKMKALKSEGLPEKFQIIDNYRLKRLSEFDINVKGPAETVKAGMEDIGILELIQDEWLKNVQDIANAVDAVNAEMSRTFIAPSERPTVGPPPPEIEEINVPVISEEEARRGQEKRAFNDGREERAVSDEAEEFHKRLHSLSRSGGKVDLNRGDATKGIKRARKKAPKPKQE